MFFTAQGSNASTIVRSIEADVIAVGVGEPEMPVMRILYSPGGNKVWSEVMNLKLPLRGSKLPNELLYWKEHRSTTFVGPLM